MQAQPDQVHVGTLGLARAAQAAGAVRTAISAAIEQRAKLRPRRSVVELLVQAERVALPRAVTRAAAEGVGMLRHAARVHARIGRGRGRRARALATWAERREEARTARMLLLPLERAPRLLVARPPIDARGADIVKAAQEGADRHRQVTHHAVADELEGAIVQALARHSRRDAGDAAIARREAASLHVPRRIRGLQLVGAWRWR